MGVRSAGHGIGSDYLLQGGQEGVLIKMAFEADIKEVKRNAIWMKILSHRGPARAKTLGRACGLVLRN